MRRGLQLAVALAVLPLTAAAVDVTWAASARTELRVRNPFANDSAASLDAGITADLELDPAASVALGVDNAVFAFSYTPTLIWREPQTGGRLLPLHQGRVGWTQRWQRATLALSEEGVYGVADIGSLRTPDGSQPGAVGEVQTLGGTPYLRSTTVGLLELRPGDRVSLGFGGGYHVSGSPEGTTNGLPLQWGPTASARLRLEASRLDGLTTNAQFAWSIFDTGQEQLVASLAEAWDRRVTRTLSFTAGAGAALTRAVVTPDVGVPGEYLEVLPVANAGVTWRNELAQQPLSVNLALRMAPFADRFTGLVYERLEGRLGAEWQPAARWAVTAGTSGALAVALGRADQAGDWLLGGDGAATWTVETWLLLQASVRVLWTETPRLGANTGQLQAVGTISVTVRQQDSLGL